MNFWELLLPPVVTILATAFTGLIVQAIIALAKYYIPFMKEKVGETQFALWRDTASLIVRSIEQSPAFIEFTGAEKKQRAMMNLASWFEGRGIPVTVELIDSLIEAAVQQMNAEINPILEVYPPPEGDEIMIPV